MHVGTYAFAPANVIMHRAMFGFAYVQFACINKTVYACVDKAVCACMHGTCACGYSKHRLMFVTAYVQCKQNQHV